MCAILKIVINLQFEFSRQKCSLFCSGGSCADVEMSKSSKILDQSETASFTNFTRNNPNENYTIIFAHFESEVGNPSPYDHNAQVQIQG